MNVLVCGSTGCIGAAVVAALRWRCHRVVETARPKRGANDAAVPLDFMAPVAPEQWAERLVALRIDAIVNCVGILMPGRDQSFERIHHLGPAELSGRPPEADGAIHPRPDQRPRYLRVTSNLNAFGRSEVGDETRSGRVEEAQEDGPDVRAPSCVDRGQGHRQRLRHVVPLGRSMDGVVHPVPRLFPGGSGQLGLGKTLT